MLVHVGIEIGHRVHDEHNVIPLIVGLTSRCFYAAACCNASDDDLGYPAASQNLLQRGAVKGTDIHFGYSVVVRLAVQFRNQFGPV